MRRGLAAEAAGSSNARLALNMLKARQCLRTNVARDK